MNNINKRLIEKVYVVLLIISIANGIKANALDVYKTADLIIFSFDRPLQLFALLESVYSNISNLNRIAILYRTSNKKYEKSYQEIQEYFPDVYFVKQGTNPRNDFKPLLQKLFCMSLAKYVLFAVDDDLVKDTVDIHDCIRALETYNAYGFYLRLGNNVTAQYPTNRPMFPPPLKLVEKDIFLFQFNGGTHDWCYQHTVDMTMYKKSTIASFIINGNYSSPNTLEAAWQYYNNSNGRGLCFINSKIVGVPLNIVQQDGYSSHENSFSAQDLLLKWQKGLAIDIQQYKQLNNHQCFTPQKPTFIARAPAIKKIGKINESNAEYHTIFPNIK